MSTSSTVTVERIRDLVMSNRAIRAPHYHADQAGIQWGADIIPALMGLFRIEEDPREDHPDGWVGFAALPDGYEPEYARDWRGEVLRLDFDFKRWPNEPDPILVLTAVYGRAEKAPERVIGDEDFGQIELPDELPTDEKWNERDRRYQAVRRDDDSDGAASVKAYVEVLPGWQREVGRRIDEIIEREVPDVRRAVKWHAPFYGVEGQGWFASFSALSKKVKLTFTRGTSLDPAPPGGSRDDSRWLDLRENDTLDEEQLASWVRQAAVIPGWGS
jgi:hypothetical protein